MLPLRLVLDTNIVISAALKPDGLERAVFLAAITKPARLYVSEEIISEYRLVLSRPELHIRRGLREQFLQLIKNRSHMVSPSRKLSITNDAADNIFLECCEASRADYLITGNRRHFPEFWRQTKIINSREFVGLIAPHILP
jgi:uncharacterized protein